MTNAETKSKLLFDTATFKGYKVDAAKDVSVVGIDIDDVSHQHYQYETVRFAKEVESGLHADTVKDYYRRGNHTPAQVEKDKKLGVAIVVKGRKRAILLRAANKQRIADGLEPHEFLVMNVKRGLTIVENMLETFSENAHRQKLNALEMAENIAHFIRVCGKEKDDYEDGDDFGLTPAILDDLSVAANVKPRHVISLLKLRQAHPQVKNAIMDGTLMESAAIALAKLPPSEQLEQLKKLKNEAVATGSKKITTEAARAAVAGRFKKPKPTHVSKMAKILDENGNGGTAAIIRFVIGEIPFEKLDAKLQGFYNQATDKKKATKKAPSTKKATAVKKTTKKTTKKKAVKKR